MLEKLELEGKGILGASRWTTKTVATFFFFNLDCGSVPEAEVRVVRNDLGTPLEKSPQNGKH